MGRGLRRMVIWMVIAMPIGGIVLMTEYQLYAIVHWLEGNMVSWRSKQQLVMSKSTAKAEYRAMSLGLSEILWVEILYQNEGAGKRPLKVWCNNKSAISISSNPIQHDRTKYVQIYPLFIKEKLYDGERERVPRHR